MEDGLAHGVQHALVGWAVIGVDDACYATHGLLVLTAYCLLLAGQF